MTTDNNKPAEIDMNEIMTRIAAHHARIAELVPANKAAVLAALAAAGITAVTVRFDGCGDSGQIEGIDAKAGEELAELPDTTVEISRIGFTDDDAVTAAEPLAEAIETVCYALLEANHAGWEINEGSFGEFVFDVEAGSISLDFSYRVESTDDYSHEF